MECNDEKFSGIVARSKTIIFIVHGGHGDSQLEINNSRTKTFPTNFVLASVVSRILTLSARVKVSNNHFVLLTFIPR